MFNQAASEPIRHSRTSLPFSLPWSFSSFRRPISDNSFFDVCLLPVPLSAADRRRSLIPLSTSDRSRLLLQAAAPTRPMLWAAAPATGRCGGEERDPISNSPSPSSAQGTAGAVLSSNKFFTCDPSLPLLIRNS
jgi:hypothetical protein